MVLQEKATGFITFIREQGVIGLAIGFILGGTVSGVVKSLVEDIINPLVGMMFGSVDSLSALAIGPVALGSFISVLINFIIIAAVVFFLFKGLGLDTMDVKKEV
jgi:large conductance mechanosensitive channel